MEKYRIAKRTEMEFGEVVDVTYDVQVFARNWNATITGMMIPILGWMMVYMFKPYVLEWRTVENFEDLRTAKFYVENDEMFETKVEAVQ